MSDLNLWQDPPKAFTVEPRAGGGVSIKHRRLGFGCMHLFFLVWVGGWTAGAVGMSLGTVSTENGSPPTGGMIALVWGIDILVAAFACYLFFTRRTFKVAPDGLYTEVRCLGFTRSFFVARESIKGLKQVKDGGEDEDSFPTWGLKLGTPKKHSLLFREPYESSLWLGQNLATFYDVPFIKADPPFDPKPKKKAVG